MSTTQYAKEMFMSKKKRKKNVSRVGKNVTLKGVRLVVLVDVNTYMCSLSSSLFLLERCVFVCELKKTWTSHIG